MTDPRFRKGFTLIELMITLVIVGIVAMIGVPSYLEYTRAAERSEAITTLNDIILQAEEFRARTGEYPTHLSDMGYTTTANADGSQHTHTPANSLYTYTIVSTTSCPNTGSNNCRLVQALVNTTNHTDDKCHSLLLDTNGTRYKLDKSENNNGDSYDKNSGDDADPCW